MLLNTAALSRLQANSEPGIRKKISNIGRPKGETTWSENTTKFSAIAKLLRDDALELEDMETKNEDTATDDSSVESMSGSLSQECNKTPEQNTFRPRMRSTQVLSLEEELPSERPAFRREISSYTQSVRLARQASHGGLKLAWMKESMAKPLNFYASRDNTRLFGHAMLSVPSMKLFHKWKKVYFVVDCFTLRLYSSVADMESEENSLFELVLDVELRVGKLRRSSTLFNKITSIGEKTKAALEGIPAEIIRMSTEDSCMHYFKTYYKDFNPVVPASVAGRAVSTSQSITSRVRSISAKSRATAVSLHAPSENGYCKLAFETLSQAQCLRSLLVQATKHTINPELDPSLVNMATR